MNLYVGAISAQDIQASQVHIATLTILAPDEDKAKSMARMAGHEQYPPLEGWKGHLSVVHPIDDVLLTTFLNQYGLELGAG